MIRLIKRKRREMFCLKEEELNVVLLADFFENSPVGEVVYVERDGKINGMITKGDFLKHVWNHTPLVNYHFQYVTEDNLSDLTERAKNPSVHRVPVMKTGKCCMILY